MKYFSIAGLQLDLELNNNKDLLIEKINQTVSRYPWLNMIVVSELAVGGASRSEEFLLDNNIEGFQNLAKEKDIWLIPGSFYHRQDKQITNVAPVISNKVRSLNCVQRIILSSHMKKGFRIPTNPVSLR